MPQNNDSGMNTTSSGVKCILTPMSYTLDALTISIQEMQRDAGRSFVSRTQLLSTQWGGSPIAVFRVVRANPDTTHAILQDILAEQRALAAASPCMAPLITLVGGA